MMQILQIYLLGITRALTGDFDDHVVLSDHPLRQVSVLLLKLADATSSEGTKEA